MKKLMAVVAAGALVATSAQAACWTREEAAAAGVRQLQSMLMVTALRCQAAGKGIMGEYNAFVTANRQAIAAQNDRLRTHFIHAAGLIAGQQAYDAFTTSMANGYGAGEGAPASCAEAATLAHEASAAGSLDALLVLVDQLSLTPRVAEGRCEATPMQVASAAPVPGPAPTDAPAVVAAAAIAPSPPASTAEVRPAALVVPATDPAASPAAPAFAAPAGYNAQWYTPRYAAATGPAYAPPLPAYGYRIGPDGR